MNILSHGTCRDDVPSDISLPWRMHTTLSRSPSSSLPSQNASMSLWRSNGKSLTIHPSFPQSFLSPPQKKIVEKKKPHNIQKQSKTTISHKSHTKPPSATTPKSHPKPPFVLVLRLQWLDANVLDQLLEVPSMTPNGLMDEAKWGHLASGSRFHEIAACWNWMLVGRMNKCPLFEGTFCALETTRENGSLWHWRLWVSTWSVSVKSPLYNCSFEGNTGICKTTCHAINCCCSNKTHLARSP